MTEPAYSDKLKLKFKQLWVDYKTTVTGLYFTDKKLASDGKVHAWQGSAGMKASTLPAVESFLEAPRLGPELQQHLVKKQ